MNLKTSFLTLFLAFSIFLPGFGQELDPISDFTVRVDTQIVRFSNEKLKLQDRWVLPFPYKKKNSVIELVLETPLLDSESDIELIRGTEYSFVDSLDYTSENEMLLRIRVADLSVVDVLVLNFKRVTKDGKEKKIPLYLYPFAQPIVQWKVAEDELFIGEEKSFELNGIQLDQIDASNLWEASGSFEYRLRQTDDRLRLYVLPLQLGSFELKIPLKAKKYLKNQNGKYATELEPLKHRFTVKGGRLAFLALDKNEIIAEQGIGQPIEIQIDRARNLPTKKTYRIETQQEAGGQLVAEIFTRSLLANDKMLCWLRPYGFHRISEGYLYIQDGDEPKFISNFNLIERTSISKISVLHEGADWSENLNVFPGEKFDIRLEGNGLLRSRINLEGIDEWVRDSTAATDQIVVYHVRLPQDINKKKITLLTNKRPSGFELSVREFQNPRNFEFVSIDYGLGYKPITQFNKPILYPQTLQNIVLKFNPEQIETVNRFYGKQYLTVDINIYNNKKELMEYKRIENVVVCPGDNSIRFPFYDNRDCNPAEISLNNQMVRKTQDLPDWGRVEILVRSNSLKYGSIGFSQKLEVIQQRKYSFDIDVSFPAGLIIKKVGSKGLGNLGGISTAIVGQLGFYKPDKIERYYPFKVGAGFSALNAFNFNENSDRDVGLVVLGSVFPTKISSRFSFPLYLGYGYLLKDNRWFYILGPGIQVRF
jgi:hypothetical protein